MGWDFDEISRSLFHLNCRRKLRANVEIRQRHEPLHVRLAVKGIVGVDLIDAVGKRSKGPQISNSGYPIPDRARIKSHRINLYIVRQEGEPDRVFPRT